MHIALSLIKFILINSVISKTLVFLKFIEYLKNREMPFQNFDLIAS